MGTLDAANLAQEADELVGGDPLMPSDLQRRCPFRCCLGVQSGKGRADQNQLEGRTRGDGELGFAPKLALGLVAQVLLLPPVQSRVGVLENRDDPFCTSLLW